MTQQTSDTSEERVEPMANTTSVPQASAEHTRDSTAAPPAVSAERIAQRAYEIYIERGGEHGRDTDDWFRAEAELINTPS
jgi:hypothetical protein